MGQEYKWDVFISHSSKDKSRARRLAELLRAAGLEVWFDEWAIPVGGDIYAAIEDGLERSRVLVLCMSEAAFGSEWVLLERGTAIFRDPGNRSRRFIPVLFEDCQVRDTIRRFLYIDWRAEDSASLARLVAACRARPEDSAGKKDEMSHNARLLKEFQLDRAAMTSLAVSPDGKYAAVSYYSGDLFCLDLRRLDALKRVGTHGENITVCCFTSQGDIATGGADGTVQIRGVDGKVRENIAVGGAVVGMAPTQNRLVVATETGTVLELSNQFRGGARIVESDVDTSRNPHNLAVCHEGRRLLVLQEDSVMFAALESGRVRSVQRHKGRATCLAAHPDGRRYVVGTADTTLDFFETTLNDGAQVPHRHLATFEGHSRAVSDLAFDGKGRLIASCAGMQETRIWRVSTGEVVAAIPRVGRYVQLTPDGKTLLTCSAANKLAVFSIAPQELEQRPVDTPLSIPRHSRYTNAKIVLVGESGVGKTGLMNRLTRDRYQETDSTHGMAVARIDIPSDKDSALEREIWLWDLAGQPDYRLIHQLFLHDTAVALFVTNPQSDDPFANVAEWNRALRVVTKRSEHAVAKLLIGARADRGGFTVSEEKIKRFVKDEEFKGHLATSARTGMNCSDAATPERMSALKQLISRSIPWNHLPFIATDVLLRELKNALIERAGRPGGDALVRFSELYQQLRQSLNTEQFEESDVRKAVTLLGNQNVILALDFGDLILLRPELMNNYASAVIRAARNHSDEIGCVAESDVLNANIDFEGVDRLSHAEEQLLLRALVQMLLDRALCLAEDTHSGRQLVFPSQYRRDRPLDSYPNVLVTYTFAGDAAIIFTTLVVRMWLGKLFATKQIWQNAAEFSTVGGAKIGFIQEKLGEGRVRIRVFADPQIGLETKAIFIRLIHHHLERTALDVKRERSYYCPNRSCGRPVMDHEAIQYRLQAGKAFIHCTYCDKKIVLIDMIEQQISDGKIAKKVQAVEDAAASALDNQAKEQLLIGHLMSIAAEANQIFRPVSMFDYGIDGEIEFKGNDGSPSGKKIYVQLKSGASYLRDRGRDGKKIFDVQNPRHLKYWQSQPCDVFLVISSGERDIRWMNITEYLRTRGEKESRQIEFAGQVLNAFTLMRMRDELIPLPKG